MSWTNFLMVIFIVYLIYYSLNLFFDFLISPKSSARKFAADELFFSETYSPELIVPIEESVNTAAANDKIGTQSANPILVTGPVSSGGVGLKQLFSLAKDNLIEHTRAIPY